MTTVEAGQETLPGMELAQVFPDQRFPVGSGHGNFAVSRPGPHSADGAWCDLGSELHWWANVSVRLDRDGARDLAAMLLAWADRVQS